MNELVAKLLDTASVASWYERHRGRARRWPARVPLAWLTELSLQDAVAGAVAGQVDWLEGGLGHPAPEIAPTRLPSAAFAARASLRVHRIHTLDARLREVALAFLAAFGEEVNINAYASGPDAAGLAPHTDPYDVFVLHTAGTKRWFLMGRDGEPSIPYDDTGGGDRGELVLEPGDLLFVPAGIKHRAQVIDGPALHLTLSLQTKTNHSLVEWLATEVGRRLGPARPPWRPRRSRDDGSYDAVVAEMRNAVASVLDGDVHDRWLRYREGLEYERTLASFEAYQATAARGYR